MQVRVPSAFTFLGDNMSDIDSMIRERHMEKHNLEPGYAAVIRHWDNIGDQLSNIRWEAKEHQKETIKVLIDIRSLLARNIYGDKPHLFEPVANLEISNRTRNCLESKRIRTLGDLIQQSEQSLFNIIGLGRKGLYEIKESLAERNLELNTKLDGSNVADDSV